MRLLLAFLATAMAGISTAGAAPITSFDGLEVSASVTVTQNGGLQGFSAVLTSSSSVTIGAGNEFSILLSGQGLFGPASGTVNLDFQDDGHVIAAAASQFSIGNTSYSDFSFDIALSFDDPGVQALTVSAAGNVLRGEHSVSGLDPIVWSFINEHDNSFGQIMTFSEATESNLPSLVFSAEQTQTDPGGDPTIVPAPPALPLMVSGLAIFGAFMRRRTEPV